MNISEPSDIGETSKSVHQWSTMTHKRSFVPSMIIGVILFGSVGYGVLIERVSTPVSIEQKLPHKSMLLKRQTLLDSITKSINKRKINNSTHSYCWHWGFWENDLSKNVDTRLSQSSPLYKYI